MSDIEIARLTDRLMRRIQANLNASAHVFDTHKVGPLGGIVLLTLAEIEPAKISDLVGLMARDKSQMTRIIKSLDDKGMLSRHDDPSDARACRLALTPKGRQTVEDIEQAVADAMSGILTPFTATDRDALKGLLRKLDD